MGMEEKRFKLKSVNDNMQQVLNMNVLTNMFLVSSAHANITNEVTTFENHEGVVVMWCG